MDDWFNDEKYKLPFYYKMKDKSDFNNCLNFLTSKKLTQVQSIDLFFTLHSLCDECIWFLFFVKINKDIETEYRLNLLKCCSFFVKKEDSIEALKQIYDEIFLEIQDEQQIFDICFLDTSFFKPLLHSSLNFLRNFNKHLLKYMLEKCVLFTKSNERWIFCIERLIHLRNLTPEEYDKLLSLIDSPLYGKIIDILLRSPDEQYIKKAHDIIHSSNVRYFESKDAVHYFEVLEEACDEINKKEYNLFEDVCNLLSMAQCICENNTEKEYLFNFARELICGCFLYNNKVKLGSVFSYCWNICNEEEKYELIKEIFTFDNDLCSYGILINLLNLITSFDKGTYLYIPENLQKKDEKLKELRKKYADDDPIWEDAEILKTLL